MVQLWELTRKKKPGANNELHKLFAINCTNGSIDAGKVQKILRDAGSLMGSKKTDIDASDVELVFARVSELQSSRMCNVSRWYLRCFDGIF